MRILLLVSFRDSKLRALLIFVAGNATAGGKAAKAGKGKKSDAGAVVVADPAAGK